MHSCDVVEGMAHAAHDRIFDEVGSWDGVTTGEGRFGSIRFLVGRRELGHLHGNTTLDLPLPPDLQAELIESGRVERHRWVPDSGWSTRRLATEADVTDAIALLRLQWERAARVSRTPDELPDGNVAIG